MSRARLRPKPHGPAAILCGVSAPTTTPKSPRRIAPGFTALYGILNLVGGFMGFRKGSVESLVVGGGLGLVLVVAAVLMFKGNRFGWKLGQWATLAVVSVALYRLVSAGGIVMWVPIMAAGLGLSFVIWSEQPEAPPTP